MRRNLHPLTCEYCGRALSPYNPRICGDCLGAAFRLAQEDMGSMMGGEFEDTLLRWHDENRRPRISSLIAYYVKKIIRNNPEDPRLW